MTTKNPVEDVSNETEEEVQQVLWQSTTWAVANGLILVLPKGSNPMEMQTWYAFHLLSLYMTHHHNLVYSMVLDKLNK